MLRWLPLSLLLLLALPLSAGAKSYQLSVSRYGYPGLADYRMQAQVPSGWKFVKWMDSDRTGVVLSSKPHRGCIAVLGVYTQELFDYDATEPRPVAFLDQVAQQKASSGFRLVGAGELSNRQAAPGGTALSPGNWGLFSFKYSGKPAYSGTGVYYSAERLEDRYFRVSMLSVQVSQNQGFGGTRCKASKLRALGKTVSKVVASAQAVS